MDFDFDGQGRAKVGALDDGAASEDVAGKSCIFQRIVKSVVAGIADERMAGLVVAVVGFNFVEVFNVFKAAVTVSGAHAVVPYPRPPPLASGAPGFQIGVLVCPFRRLSIAVGGEPWVY